MSQLCRSETLGEGSKSICASQPRSCIAMHCILHTSKKGNHVPAQGNALYWSSLDLVCVQLLPCAVAQAPSPLFCLAHLVLVSSATLDCRSLMGQDI